MKISIIILTYNSLSLIEDCLDSIYKYNDIGDELEIIVADNNSDDQHQMFEKIRIKYNKENIKLYDTGENGGYGKGNNYGISMSTSNIIIVMNPDVRLINPIFSLIVNYFEDTSLGMAGVEFIDGSCPYYFKPEYSSLFHSIFMRLYLKLRRYNPHTMYMSGSFLIFNKKSFQEAGGYDEKIFMYYEEPDITNRILNVGKNVKWLKGIMVQHLAHGRKFNAKLTEINYKSFEYYCKKYNIDPMPIYRNNKYILKLKILASRILKDMPRTELFKKKLQSLIEHIK